MLVNIPYMDPMGRAVYWGEMTWETSWLPTFSPMRRSIFWEEMPCVLTRCCPDTNWWGGWSKTLQNLPSELFVTHVYTALIETTMKYEILHIIDARHGLTYSSEPQNNPFHLLREYVLPSVFWWDSKQTHRVSSHAKPHAYGAYVSHQRWWLHREKPEQHGMPQLVFLAVSRTKNHVDPPCHGSQFHVETIFCGKSWIRVAYFGSTPPSSNSGKWRFVWDSLVSYNPGGHCF